ncbi:hypothetical protein HRR81_002200 [Exophiala dermatitidis]|nr:hypothetical protein HRR81_002200 [Exophiala dermatitidis]
MSIQLAFINVSGSEGHSIGKDAVTKSQVRSQVMKNMRRKQRLEGVKKYAEAERPSETESQSSVLGSNFPRDKPQAQRTDLPEYVEHGHHAEVYTPFGAVSRRSNTTSASTPMPNESRSNQFRHNRLSCWRTTLSPSTTPLRGWHVGGTNTETLSPKELHEMLYITESYVSFLSQPLELTHLLPHNSTIRKSRLRYCFQANTSSELVLFTTNFVHLGHTTAMRPIHADSPDFIRAKAKTLEHLQRSVSSTLQRPPAELIGCVMLVLSYEMVHGGMAVPIHYEGLTRLLALQPSTTALHGHADALTPSIKACDLILAATSSGHTPALVKMEAPTLVFPRQGPRVQFYRSSLLLLDEDFSALRGLYLEVPARFIDLLEETFEATRRHLSALEADYPAIDRRHAAFLTVASTNTSVSAVLDHPSAARQGPLLPHVVQQAADLAATMHFRATRQGIPFEDPRNREDIAHLKGVLSGKTMSAWCGIPYVYLWVLLTGAAAAQFRPERQYFMAELVRFGLSVALEYSDDFRRILLNFIWLRRNISPLDTTGRSDHMSWQGQPTSEP